MDAQQLGIRSSVIDVVLSINAFEHVPEPEQVLREIHRILRAKGYAFISFCPCYYSDVGSHMAQFVPEPWAHLKYSEEEYISKLRLATPGTEYWVREFKSALNRKTRKYFIELFEKYTSRSSIGRIFHKPCFKILEQQVWQGVENPSHLDHQNFEFLKQKYPTEELLFQGMYLVLQKN
jgi:ubiquinone/menaquinone biosynthesis C-methylase UbiE